MNETPRIKHKLLRLAKAGIINATEPALYLLAFCILIVVWQTFAFPTPGRLFGLAEAFFQKHGFIVVLIAAFAEGIVLFNLYFPGSFVIVLGVTSFRTQPWGATWIVLATQLGFFLSSFVNYFIGHRGFYYILNRLIGTGWLERAQRWQQRFGGWAIYVAFAHPNVGAFLSVALGRARFPLRKFAINGFVAIIAWNALWGYLAYRFAAEAKQVVTNPRFMLALLSLWFSVKFGMGVFRMNAMTQQEGLRSREH